MTFTLSQKQLDVFLDKLRQSRIETTFLEEPQFFDGEVVEGWQAVECKRGYRVVYLTIITDPEIESNPIVSIDRLPWYQELLIFPFWAYYPLRRKMIQLIEQAGATPWHRAN